MKFGVKLFLVVLFMLSLTSWGFAADSSVTLPPGFKEVEGSSKAHETYSLDTGSPGHVLVFAANRERYKWREEVFIPKFGQQESRWRDLVVPAARGLIAGITKLKRASIATDKRLNMEVLKSRTWDEVGPIHPVRYCRSFGWEIDYVSSAISPSDPVMVGRGITMLCPFFGEKLGNFWITEAVLMETYFPSRGQKPIPDLQDRAVRILSSLKY